MASIDKSRTMPAALRPGPSGLPPGQVAEIQRSRMLSAAIQAVEEVGYTRMTVAQVISRAKVSRKTFYDVFIDREDCFLAAFEQTIARARTRVTDAYARQPSWRDGIRAALEALLELMEREPGLARLAVVEALAAGPRILESRAVVLAELAGVVDRGRSATTAGEASSPVTAEGVVGAIFAVLHSRLLERDGEPLTSLVGPLMSMIVLPYLGAEVAGSELERPPRAPRALTGRPVKHADPLEGLDMRLTYRTVRVLVAIGEKPGVSNRDVARAAGIADPGQISKLLRRLERLELVENRGHAQTRGSTNAWYLTARGIRVTRATRRH
jgi:AcrR family transcriptional regulator/DNA-binding MarR family transcriptional regulator